MKVSLACNLSRKILRRSSNAISIIQHPPKLSSHLEEKPIDRLSLKDLLKSDIKMFNTKTITDVLYSGAYKFEDGIKNFDNSIFSVTQSDRLNVFYLYLLSKSRFLKHDQLIPLLRSYDIFQLSILNNKCWEIIGRILNNCINIYSDSELVDICYHLTRITTIPQSIKELEIFWQRIIIQSPNWFNRLHKLDTVTLIHLLHLCKSKHFDIDYTDQVIDAIKNNESLFFTIEDLSIVSFLIEVMANNDIFDREILNKSSQILSQINPKLLSVKNNLVDFDSLIWNFGYFMMKYRNAKDCLSGIDVGRLGHIVEKMKIKNEKIFTKLNKSLYLLGLSSNEISPGDIDPKQCNEVYELEVIESFYTIELVKNSSEFFKKYSLKEYERINIPLTIKAFYLLNNNISWSNEAFEWNKYIDRVSELSQLLSSFLIVKPSENHELILEHSNHLIGLVLCDFVDFLYPDASDVFLQGIKSKYGNIPVYKVRFQ